MNVDIEKRSEGCRLTAYPDPGTGGAPWTIGYGHIKGVKRGDTCTQAQAEAWLLDDLRISIGAVKGMVHVPLTDGEESALVDFVFNVGAGNLEHSTLLRLVNSGDHLGASQEFGKWNHASGKVLAGLTKRRAAEAEMFLGRVA
jgi:Phage-related lysozyme (muraminidase)